MSYVLLDLMFLGCALLVTFAAVLLRRQQLSRQNVWAVAVALLCVLILTAVFDNVMIGVGLVAYDPARILGLRIGLAPIEDFAYPIAVALLVPALWALFPARRAPGWDPGRHRQHAASATGVGDGTSDVTSTSTSTSTSMSTGTGTSTGTSTGMITGISTGPALGFAPSTVAAGPALGPSPTPSPSPRRSPRPRSATSGGNR